MENKWKKAPSTKRKNSEDYDDKKETIRAPANSDPFFKQTNEDEIEEKRVVTRDGKVPRLQKSIDKIN